MKMSEFKAYFGRYLPDLPDFLGVFGFSSVIFGVYQVYPPAAFIVAGGLLMTIAYLKATK
jgi:hypothetical protein